MFLYYCKKNICLVRTEGRNSEIYDLKINYIVDILSVHYPGPSKRYINYINNCRKHKLNRS